MFLYHSQRNQILIQFCVHLAVVKEIRIKYLSVQKFLLGWRLEPQHMNFWSTDRTVEQILPK